MFGIHDLWLFVLSGLLLNVTPGPDTLYIVGRSSTQGSRAGAVAALGIGAGDAIRFVRVGTLDEPTRFPPDIHIYTGTKQSWLTLPSDTPAEIEYYRASERWPAESLERRAALLAKFPRRG